ncbi:Rha family transcriptional regulator [Azotobacter vinelandii]|uniref:Rha family transcriptional regulator n=1 Tax=Azotobacter vinelandii TaxID=354 RepID=UPI0007744630|nr:Rha family transcriptional regulator [Azotobacter vinelandii]
MNSNTTTNLPITEDANTQVTVEIFDGKATTTSIDIARHFGKQHKNVLKAVRDLLPELPSDHQRNFAPMIIEVEIGKGAIRKDPAYRITRDGFTLLAMGFTGKRALQFQLAYIDAFNRMEERLAQQKDKASAGVEADNSLAYSRVGTDLIYRIVQAAHQTEMHVNAIRARQVAGEQYGDPSALHRIADELAELSNLTRELITHLANYTQHSAKKFMH